MILLLVLIWVHNQSCFCLQFHEVFRDISRDVFSLERNITHMLHVCNYTFREICAQVQGPLPLTDRRPFDSFDTAQDRCAQDKLEAHRLRVSGSFLSVRRVQGTLPNGTDISLRVSGSEG